MRLFNRSVRKRSRAAEPAAPAREEQRGSSEPAREDCGEIRVSRTLVKSEPELAELVSARPKNAIAVTLSEKGFGTRVAISAAADSGLGKYDDLERFLDELAEPQKRPFSNG